MVLVFIRHSPVPSSLLISLTSSLINKQSEFAARAVDEDTVMLFGIRPYRTGKTQHCLLLCPSMLCSGYVLWLLGWWCVLAQALGDVSVSRGMGWMGEWSEEVGQVDTLIPRGSIRALNGGLALLEAFNVCSSSASHLILH